MELQDKITKFFDGKVVRKDLTKTIKGNAVVPTYVLEYLLGQHCATFDDDIIAQGLEKVKNIIRDHFVHRDEAEVVKSTIREKRIHKIIDKIVVRLNESKDIYEATFINLGLKNVPITGAIIKQHRKLLSGGVWCIVSMGYEYDESEKIPWFIQDLKPIQISQVDLEEYVSLRKEFTKDEWIDFLIQSIGLEPKHFDLRAKLLQLSRLIPHCENNYNFIELGPKGTGKSHVFSELSPHGILISGGDVTQAKLFVNNANNQIGLVGYWDIVGFDEFAGSQKKSDKKLVDIMKNYMANKSFSRGRDVFGATASFAFIGNTEHSVPNMIRNSNLFIALPKAYYDTAFLDRIHNYLPGWEVDKLRSEMFTSGYGFIVDYLAEILKELRKDDYGQKLSDYVQLDSSLTTRDKDAITKTFSGLVKIIYPHGELSHEEALELIDYAIEGRKRVKNQLIKIDDTFEEVSFEYNDVSTGMSINIETLENKNYDSALQEPSTEEQPSDPPEQVTELSISDMIATGESEKLEFKQTYRYNTHTKETDEKLLFACSRAIASFLNTDGGVLLIGVTDSGGIFGIEKEFDSNDSFLIHINSHLLGDRLGITTNANVKIEIIDIDTKKICKVSCLKSPEPVFLDNRFFVRRGPTTIEMKGPDILKYCKEHF